VHGRAPRPQGDRGGRQPPKDIPRIRYMESSYKLLSPTGELDIVEERRRPWRLVGLIVFVVTLVGAGAGGTAWWLHVRSRIDESSFEDARLRGLAIGVDPRSRTPAGVGARVGAILQKANCERATPARVGALLDSFPTWTDGSLSRIACRQINRGMTREQLRSAWGAPRRVSLERGGRVETWYYGGDSSVIMLDTRIRMWYGGGKSHE
jgi:hypothetical protein